MKKENVFRVGDKVWHPVYREGLFDGYFNDGGFQVTFNNKVPMVFSKEEIIIISFSPYELNANQVRPFQDLNEPKVGDDVILWDRGRRESAIIDRLKSIGVDFDGRNPIYFTEQHIKDNCIKWDGTKEQFDRIRSGGVLRKQ